LRHPEESLMTTITHQTQRSFDEIYAKAQFGELIRLSLLLAGGLVKLRDRLTAAKPAAAH
jgi:hypothetical protein